MKEVIFCGRLSGCLEEDCLCRPVLRNGMGGGKGGRSNKVVAFFCQDRKILLSLQSK